MQTIKRASSELSQNFRTKMESTEHNSELFEAVEHNRYEKIQKILMQGGKFDEALKDTNENGENVLMVAAKQGSVRTFQEKSHKIST